MIGEFLILAVILAFACLLICAAAPVPERGASFGEQYVHGKWRVLYLDGQYSQTMYRGTAERYAEMFGGKVVPKSAYVKDGSVRRG